MHYLVTGAQGFLGAQIVDTLRSTGDVVSATGRQPEENTYLCDLTNRSEVFRMIYQLEPDCIIHCAAHVPNSAETYNDNISADISMQMLGVILENSSCPVVFVSSMTVYGKEGNNPVSEQDAGDPISAYGKGKLQAESLLKADGRPSLAVRIPGLFGPARKYGLVYNLIYALKYGYSLPQLPDIEILWAAMHVEDAAQGIAKLSRGLSDNFNAVNIGYREKYSISRLIVIVSSIYGRIMKYAVQQPVFEFDLTRADILGAVPTCSFRDALLKFGSQL